ncbi:MAG: hypothetical protein FWD47_07790 [Treponema sp.]|nr:hypothetical protein [Treponema sp.]
MKKRYFLALFPLFLAAATVIYAQSGEYVPYVTNIGVEARNNLIRLTWIDSPDAQGPVYIFRSVRPFSGSIPANIRPVIVRYGEQFYIDDTDGMENIYYFIAASDISGQRFDIILPRVNNTSIMLAQTNEDNQMPVFIMPQTGLAPTEVTDGIYNLWAAQDGDRVVITFQIIGQHGNPILYRSTQPIRQPQDLLNAVIVQSGVRSPFIDFPVPGFTWYYSVIFEDEIAAGNMGIIPGINSTATPIMISGDQSIERPIRPMPLPILSFRDVNPDSLFITEIPGQQSLSMQAINLLRNSQMPQKAPLVLKWPRAFAIDLEAPTGGEESALIQIVTEHFVKFEWETALVSLQRYLSSPRSREIEMRSRFYLGQSLYYTGNYRAALMEFLSFRSIDPAEANSWIEAILAAMVY